MRLFVWRCHQWNPDNASVAVRLHEQLPLDPATPVGMLMVVLRRQRMTLRDANLLPAHNAAIDAGKRRKIAGRVFLIEDVAVVLVDMDCVFEGCHRGYRLEIDEVLLRANHSVQSRGRRSRATREVQKLKPCMVFRATNADTCQS